MSERIEAFVQFVFLVTGGLFLFFSGFVVITNSALSFILLVVGICCINIRFEYAKDEGATE